MNERIKQLVKQVDLGWTIQRANIQGDNRDLERVNKFAELIILESISVMKQHDYHGEWLGEKLKKHFGGE